MSSEYTIILIKIVQTHSVFKWSGQSCNYHLNTKSLFFQKILNQNFNVLTIQWLLWAAVVVPFEMSERTSARWMWAGRRWTTSRLGTRPETCPRTAPVRRGLTGLRFLEIWRRRCSRRWGRWSRLCPSTASGRLGEKPEINWLRKVSDC